MSRLRRRGVEGRDMMAAVVSLGNCGVDRQVQGLLCVLNTATVTNTGYTTLPAATPGESRAHTRTCNGFPTQAMASHHIVRLAAL